MTNELGMEKVVKEVLWHLDAEFEEMGWDQPPRLMLVATAQISNRAGLVEMRSLPGWEDAAFLAETADGAIRALVHAYQTTPPSIVKAAIAQGLFGLAFVSEAFLLRVPLTEAEDALKNGREHPISEDPNRVDVRMTYLKPIHGDDLMLVHEKDGIAQMVEDDRKMGEIPDLLGQLLKVIAG